jgi:hypothetical protein
MKPYARGYASLKQKIFINKNLKTTIMKKFIDHNKVLLSAIVAALMMTIQQALSARQTSFKVIGFAVLIAVIGVIANQWKGKGVTITGIVGTLAGVFINLYQTGTFTWNEFILSAVVALLTAVSGSLQPEKHEEEVKLPYSAEGGAARV